MAFSNALRSAAKLVASSESSLSNSAEVECSVGCTKEEPHQKMYGLPEMGDAKGLSSIGSIFEILGNSLFSSEFTFLLENTIMLTVSRGFHSTGMKRMGGGHGHDEPYYLHAKHMYNLDRMKHQGLKMSLAVFTAFSIGVAVPVYAVIFQQKKTASS
ncbi:hypothetical protein JHK82_027801 [Glycine max]|nr:hypothetical protein JHK85_028454 [Glycine max]KAG5003804.1 hypothetical protein JHK86_027943 [Glycine max]KAG5126966.1 hypothetical protein JHK82_027801 [Glycine max]KAG5151582.1 hypothetical protein JHK84_028054 [Glycine max]